MRFLILCFMFFFVESLWGQTPVVKEDLGEKTLKLYKKALVLSRQNKYEDSDKVLNKVLAKYPDFVDATLLKAGNSYNEGDYDQAISLFEIVVGKYPSYNSMAYYSLATAQYAAEKYADASKSYAYFAEQNPSHRKTKTAIELSKKSAFISNAIKNPVPFNPEKLEGNINSDMHEYMPVPSVDGKSIVFTRRVNNQEDFYVAHIENGKVAEVLPFADLNTQYNEGVHTTSADGKKMIYTACDRKREHSGCDLFYREWKDGKWSNELNMGHIINTSAWEAQPSLSADGKVLLFSSNREGSKGKDIWISARSDSRGWSKPRPISSVINTAGDEESPFLHPDGQTLYFRSTGHLGMGDFDIFYSKYETKTKQWSKPKNIGYPINTKGNEGAFTVSLDGRTAYFSSDQNHEGKEQKNLDIFKFTLYPEARPLPTTFVKITVTDMDTGLPIDCEFITKNIQKNTVVDKGSTDNGEITTALPALNEYATIIEKEGYLYHSENFNLKEVKSVLEPFIINVKLQKIPLVPTAQEVISEVIAEPVIMKNVFFDTGSAHLKSSSNFEIDKLYDLLVSEPTISVEIIGHTDNTGTDSINNKLSFDRAFAIKSRLIQMGIAEARLSATGKGASQPITDNETEEGRQLNRRTEFIIIR